MTRRGRERQILALLLLALLALPTAGCSTNPATGRSEVVFMTPEREAEIGAQESKRVAEEMGLVEDARVAAYVAKLGERIAHGSPRRNIRYSFRIVDLEEPNAFALPGGYIYVSRGLLALTNSEAELANVLGHEIAHVAARHAAQRETRATGVGLLTLGSAILGAALGPAGGLLGAPLDALGAGVLASYSRDQEREADRIGQDLVARAGIDPRGMPAFLRNLERATRIQRGMRNHPSFFDSHPTTPERVGNTARTAEQLGVEPDPDSPRERASYLRTLDGLLVGPDPAQGVFQGDLFLHPELDFTLRFPPGWQPVNTRQSLGAISPRRDAKIVLEVQGGGADPERAGEHFIREVSRNTPLDVVQSQRGEVGGLPAYRALAMVRTRDGTFALYLTWIAHREAIFRITGISPGGLTRDVQLAIEACSGSFRALLPEQRASIQGLRLKSVGARAGESLAEVGARSRNAWDLSTTAVFNGLEPGAPLAPGLTLKMALRHPYRAAR